jgi:O-antigen/teichoic acid export membrane protein
LEFRLLFVEAEENISMSAAPDYSGNLLAKNTLLNFGGQAIPLVVGIGSTPFIIHGLGTARFGILSLIWIILVYFSLFDLGIGRATIKFFAELLGKNENDKLAALFWSSLFFNILLGLIGGMAMFLATPSLIHRVFNIPQELLVEAQSAFYLLSALIPLIVATTTLRGALEGAQRFDLVNAVKIPSSSLTFIIPLGAVLFNYHLPGIVFLLLLARTGTAVMYLILCFKVFPSLKDSLSIERRMIVSLFKFGGWVAVSNFLTPLLVYSERFFIGSVLSMDDLAFYTAPHEIVTRLWILPMSFVVTLFPVFSSLRKERHEDIAKIYAQSSKYLLLIVGPLVLFIVLFAKNILMVWLGSEFAQKSTLVFQILAVGVLINSLINIPFSLIQGLGRPDITAKFHLLELPIYIGLAWFLITKWGITGAALAWCLRVALDAGLIFWASHKLIPSSVYAFVEHRFVRAAFLFSGLVVACLAAVFLLSGTILQILASAGLLAIYGVAVWKYLLTSNEKRALPFALKLKSLKK